MGEVSVLMAIVGAIAATIAGFISAASIVGRFYFSREEGAVLKQQVKDLRDTLSKVERGQHEILAALRDATSPLVRRDGDR